MTDYPMLTLNDGRNLPQLGFGTWQIEDDKAADAVRTAVDVGYAMVDTAAIYHNERGVGHGLREAPWIFLQTKIWNDSQGYDRTLRAAEKALDRLGRDSVDMLLIHWPAPERDLFVETWKALVTLCDEGKAKSIGVSNFRAEDLKRIVDATGKVPALNQVELHPAFQQRELRAVHEQMGIVTQSWSPLGQGGGMAVPAIAEIAAETGRDPAAVVLRWHLQHGLCAIPKASSRAHIAANFGCLDFALDENQMARIDALDRPDGRIGPEPSELN